jgi:hypothetical protein
MVKSDRRDELVKARLQAALSAFYRAFSSTTSGMVAMALIATLLALIALAGFYHE